MSKYLDTRDLAERLEELEGLRDVLDGAKNDREVILGQPNVGEDEISAANDAVDRAELDFDEEEREELEALESLRHEMGSQWKDETLIPEDEFEDYARQLAEDIGAVDESARWPACHIDWAAAADALKMDYSLVTFRGRDYYYRA